MVILPFITLVSYHSTVRISTFSMIDQFLIFPCRFQLPYQMMHTTLSNNRWHHVSLSTGIMSAWVDPRPIKSTSRKAHGRTPFTDLRYIIIICMNQPTGQQDIENIVFLTFNQSINQYDPDIFVRYDEISRSKLSWNWKPLPDLVTRWKAKRSEGWLAECQAPTWAQKKTITCFIPKIWMETNTL